MIIVNSGDGSSRTPKAHTTAIAFDLDGNQKYAIAQKEASSPSQSASFVPGVGFIAVDRALIAFDAATGSTLWSYPSMDGFYASPAIVPSGVYDVDLSGNVYAFGLTQTAVTAPAGLREVPHDRPVIAKAKEEPSKRAIALWGLLLGGGVGIGAVLFVRLRKRS